MLELKKIRKSYEGIEVLKNINLKIEKGEIVSILGPSGCGKTTLLNLILGLTQVSEGRIIFDGEDITQMPMEKRGFNIVFQDYALFPNLNVYENIVYGLKNKPNISTTKEVQDLINLLGLGKHLTKKIEELSGGQKQRTALARTLVMKPKILLLDEPLSALDGVIKESIKQKIKEIARDFKLTTIIVTHDPEEALTLSDKVLIVNEGQISQFGTPEEIIKKPANDFVSEFILRQLEIKRNNILELFWDGNDRDRKRDSSGGLMMNILKTKQKELQMIFIAVIIIFAGFLLLPFIEILYQSIAVGDGVGLKHFATMLDEDKFAMAFGNSIAIASTSAILSTLLAFILAYTIHYTNINKTAKRLIQILAIAPMFLPTITYGFAIIYSLGKQGFLTKVFNIQIDIYGFNGLLIGYIIYTMPIAFLLIYNAMKYIDKKFMIVSKIMGDSLFKTFRQTLIRPIIRNTCSFVYTMLFLMFHRLWYSSFSRW